MLRNARLFCFLFHEVDSAHGQFVFYPPTDCFAIVYPDAPLPWRPWRDAVFADPFGQSHEWIKFAEPSSDNALRFYPRMSSRVLSTSITKLAEPAAAAPGGFTSR